MVDRAAGKHTRNHPGGGGIQPVLMRPPPSYLSKLGRGRQLGGVGGRVGVGIGGTAGGEGVPHGGGLHATHYYHMHTRGGMCVWGYGGMEVCMR